MPNGPISWVKAQRVRHKFRWWTPSTTEGQLGKKPQVELTLAVGWPVEPAGVLVHLSFMLRRE